MSENAVEFSLNFTYNDAEEAALKDVRGKIPAGHCIVLCGSSGCGKSTLLRCLNHLIPEFYDGELSGSCKINGKDLEKLTIGQTGQLAASVFQDPRSQFFTLNSNTEIAFGLENSGCPREQMIEKTEEAFRLFHQEKLKNRNVFSLSGGERQMIAILSAWAMDTDILLLDEPTANLDHCAVSMLADALKILKEKGKTLLISEHRLYYLKGIADEYWQMEKGQIIRKYSAEEFESLDAAALSLSGLRTTSLDSTVSCLQKMPAPQHTDTLRVQNLRFRYKTMSEDVINNVSFEAQTGEVTGLIGANGCGKTTLGKVLSGLCKSKSGTITFNGTPLCNKSLKDHCIFIMQEAEFQFFTDSVKNELLYGHKPSIQLQEKIDELLKFTGLYALRDRHPFSLSGGQMQKLVMLLACLSEKPVVVLDEPTAGLDHESLTICAKLIRQLQKEKIVFLISHDLELLSMVCTRALFLEKGAIARTLDLHKSENFEILKDYMRCHLKSEDGVRKLIPQKMHRHLDPRAKLFFLIAALIAGVGTNFPLIMAVTLTILAASVYEKNWKLPFASAVSMICLYLLYRLYPAAGTSFLLHFFPRILVMGAGVALMAARDEVPRILSGLRALHISEKVNMIMSVIFRFFPVLHSDLAIMSQSVKTRGFFSTFREKVKRAPEYLEMLIVPMVFRVLRIAETLSASAETRGISLDGRRTSYTAVHFKIPDAVFIVLMAVMAALSLINF